MKNISILFIISFFSLSNLYGFNLKNGFILALEHDMDSKVNENNLKNIKYDQDIADSLLLPKVDFTASAETTKRTENQKTPGEGAYTKTDEYKFEVTQPIFDGFESKYEKELQKKRFESAVFYLKQSHNDLALNYVQSYINVLRDKELLSASLENIATSEDIFKKVYKKIELGYGTKLEFQEVKGNLAESRVNENIQRINFKESLEALKYYVQRDFDSSELSKPTFFVTLPETLDEAVNSALKDNPSVNVSKINLDVSVAEKKKTQKEFYPTVDFVGTYNLDNSYHAEDDTEYNEYSVGFNLNYNLYNGGRDYAEVKKALQDIEEKKFLIRKSEYQVKNSVRLAWNSYHLNEEKNKSLKEFYTAKKDILDASFKEFDLGLQNLNTLLETYIEYVDVKKDYISSNYDLLYAKYNLLASLGKLSDALMDKLPSIEKSKDTYKVESNNLFDTLDKSYSDIQLGQNELDILRAKTSLESENYEKPIVKKASFSDSFNEDSFKDKFLKASPNKYTINLALLYNETDAKQFLKNNNLDDNAFYFSFGKEKKYIKVMMGVYNTKAEADTALSNLNSTLKRNQPKIERVTVKQKLYNKYNNENKQNDEKHFYVNNNTALIQRASYTDIKTNENTSLDISFKDKFLKASDDKYTINLALFYDKKNAKKFLKNHKLKKDAFSFSFGSKKTLQKVMYGIFDSKKEAKKALKALSKVLKKNQPRIEKVAVKQKLYRKYHGSSFNSIESGSI